MRHNLRHNTPNPLPCWLSIWACFSSLLLYLCDILQPIWEPDVQPPPLSSPTPYPPPPMDTDLTDSRFGWKAVVCVRGLLVGLVLALSGGGGGGGGGLSHDSPQRHFVNALPYPWEMDRGLCPGKVPSQSLWAVAYPGRATLPSGLIFFFFFFLFNTSLFFKKK